MESGKKKLWMFGGTALAVLLLDQITKYWVRLTPSLHDHTIIEGWLGFHYTQNPGMAMGIAWADTWVISLIAMLATALILAYVWKTHRAGNASYMVCMGLIVGGALGNIYDRLFIARIQDTGTFLEGAVVDFIHFKLQIGGTPVFPYIFNVADAAITVAIVLLLVFFRRLMPAEEQVEHAAPGSADGQQEKGNTGHAGRDGNSSSAGRDDDEADGSDSEIAARGKVSYGGRHTDEEG